MGQITIDQSHQVMAALTTNTHWNEIDFEEAGLQDWVVRNGREAGRQFTTFLKNGARMGTEVAIPKEESPLNTIIRVNRSVRPTYPDFMEKVIHLELECTGPAEYDLATAVSLWLHDGQKGSSTTKGKVIYDHLKGHHMLRSCLSLQDALEIREKGVTVFRKVFGDNDVNFWKSVVRILDYHQLFVPCLCVFGDEVKLSWNDLDDEWRHDMPAVRFDK